MGKPQGLIGILGGLGPEAGRLLHGYIIEEAAQHKPITCDQDHYDVIHLALPSIIPDRATYIFDQTAPNPTLIMFNILQGIGYIARQFQRPVSVCIPCNTYHAPVLYAPLLEKLAQSDLCKHVCILNLIEVSVAAVRQQHPQVQRVGLISTSGERASGIYRHYLNQQNLELIQVDEILQQQVDDIIYNPVYGLKATSSGTPYVRSQLTYIVDQLQAMGSEILILGCTELPFVFDQNFFSVLSVVSPMRVMAKELINRCENFGDI